MADKNLTAGLEDYLEAIYIAQSENKTVKGIDVARMLNISRASVSEALSKLLQLRRVNGRQFRYILGLNQYHNMYIRKGHFL